MNSKNKEEIHQKFYEEGYLYRVKIFYSNKKHKYANLFDVKKYEAGKRIGSIIGYRRMNILEKFIFRNCL